MEKKIKVERHHLLYFCPSSISFFDRGQMPIHVLCQYGRDNAAAIFDLFKESMPDYPMDAIDSEGNTGNLNTVHY